MTPHVIWTLRAIARRLGVAEEETVLGYAMRVRDPLRLWFLLGKHWMKTAKIDAWRARQQPDNDCERVVGLEEIARRMKKSVNTVKAYARRRHDPLPINGLGGRDPWMYEDARLDWMDGQNKPAVAVQLTARRSA